jgi:hypothetical protein
MSRVILCYVPISWPRLEFDAFEDYDECSQQSSFPMMQYRRVPLLSQASTNDTVRIIG